MALYQNYLERTLREKFFFRVIINILLRLANKKNYNEKDENNILIIQHKFDEGIQCSTIARHKSVFITLCAIFFTRGN